ncbi:hypothetical protein [Flavobacterium olei]|uniref:hypothetical protein n=1 Tax=Flavobacterium olei TaxID=1886782 RepID=UPI003219C7D4
MKTIILSVVTLLLFGVVNAQDNHFKIGAHVGLPISKSYELFDVNMGLDAAYLWGVTDKFSAGVTTGYTMYISKTYMGQYGPMTRSTNQNFVPLAGTAQYSLSDKWFTGADLGFALNVNGDLDRAILFQPKFGYQTKRIELFASYKGIVDDYTISSLNLGFNYKF